MLFVLYSAESPGDHQREIRYLSVCSGIEAATVAWHPLGWKPFAFAEIEKFPSAVLAHHYPHVPNLGDITKFKEWPDADIDLLVGGTPCQSFSVAGLRKGLDDPRGNLALTYCAILNKYRPRWFVWENVPGVLSVDGGRAFGSILGAVAELGYGFAWRVLDAQYVRVDGFGRAVPQRRRRVFVVGHLGDWRRAAAVLFERESLLGHSPPRRQAGQRVAPTISSRPTGGGGLGTDFDLDGGLIPAISHPLLAKANDSFDDTLQSYIAAPAVANPLTARMHKGVNTTMDEGQTMVAHALRGEDFDASEDGTGRGTPLVPIAYSITPSNSNKDYNARIAEKAQAITGNGNRPSARGGDLIAFSCKDHGADAGLIAPTLRSMGHDGSHANAGGQVAVAFQSSQSGVRLDDVHATLDSNNGSRRHNGVISAWAVRRLTPTECERLQAFRDGYTDIPWRGKANAPDGPRYKVLGNSMAVNVMRWLGWRIQMVRALVGDAGA